MNASARYECDEVHFRSWEDFKAGFEDHLNRASARKEHRYVFRGQGNAKWPLQTKFAREMTSLPGPKRTAVANAAYHRQALLGAFWKQLELADLLPTGLVATASRGAGSRKKHSSVLDDASIWALGQHYSLPTPLLDWSVSPYVAAFFACETAAGDIKSSSAREVQALDERFAVFALRRHEFRREWKRMGVQFLEDCAPENKRIRPQLGLFTFTPKSDASLELVIAEFCQRHGRKVSDFLVKFTLPFSAALPALVDLQQMDITARRIYADIGGASRSATLAIRLQAFEAG